MNVRRLGALALSICAVLSIASAGTAGAKSASSSSGPTFTPVAGSANYLVYVQFPHGGFGHPALVQGTLLVKPLHGKTETLGTITNAARLFSLSRSMLVYADGLDHPVMHWINLSSGRSGTFKPHMDDAAAPHGWVYLQRAGPPPYAENAPEYLYEHVIGGKTTRLGVPLHHTIFGALAVGSHDLVVYDPGGEDADSGVVTMKFDQPGKFRTLVPEHTGANDGADCSSPTATKVACGGGYGGGPPHLWLFDLATGKTLIDHTAIMKCPGTYLAVLQDSIAYIQYDCHHRLGYINTAGTTHFSRRSFYRNDLISALGGVAVETTKSHNHLILFTGRGNSQTIVGT